MATFAVVALAVGAGVPGLRNTLATYNRNGAVREIMAQIRNTQSAAVTRDGVYVFQWGGDTAVGYPQSQYRVVKDTGTCALPAATTAKNDTTVLTYWTDLALSYPGTKIQSVVDNSGTAVAKIMFNSRGASINSCLTANFPVTVTVADDLGFTRAIKIQSAGSVRLQ
jgi:type II secretory pathway pseudopilin PulG